MTTKERRYAQLQAASDARWYVYQAARDGMMLETPKSRTVSWAVECLISAGVIVNTNKGKGVGIYRVVREMGEAEVRGLVAKRENGVRSMRATYVQGPDFAPLPEGMSQNAAIDYLDRVARSLLRHCRKLESMVPGARPWEGGDLLTVTSRNPVYLDNDDKRRKKRGRPAAI